MATAPQSDTAVIFFEYESVDERPLSSWQVTTISLREVQSYIPHRRQPFHLGDMTMKVLCISKWAKAPSPEERDAILPKEVPATLKLYLDGV